MLSLFTDVSTDVWIIFRYFSRKMGEMNTDRATFGFDGRLVDLRFGEAFGTEPSGHLFCV